MRPPRLALAARLRRLRLLWAVDRIRFVRGLLRDQAANRQFRSLHPQFPLPPADLAFDAYDHVHWPSYHDGGITAARFIADSIRRHRPHLGLRICEWGCGPARVLRHLPEAIGDPTATVMGSDYNRRSVAWCRRHIPGIDVFENGLEPPLPLTTGGLDCVYAISVFTHLAVDTQRRWMAELLRVVGPDGIVIFTTHGAACLPLLLPTERRTFETGEPVVRGQVCEGRKSFVAFHPERFVRQVLLADATVLEHLPAPTPLGGSQEVWVVAGDALTRPASTPETPPLG